MPRDKAPKRPRSQQRQQQVERPEERAEAGNDITVHHPAEIEKQRDERANERNAGGEGYETERSGAV